MPVSSVNFASDGWYFWPVSLFRAVSMYSGQFANLMLSPGAAPKSTLSPAVVGPLPALEPSPLHAARIDARLRPPTLMPAYLIMLRRDIRRCVMPRISAELISGDGC